MFIELIPLLGCVNVHEDTWLVAAFSRLENRHVIEGRLGCPVCGTEYVVSGGIADFTGLPPEGSTPPPTQRTGGDEHEEALRLAALLHSGRATGPVVLEGRHAVHAADVARLIEAQSVALNAAAALPPDERVAVVRAADAIPVRPATAHGVVLDRADAGMVEWAARVLRPGGRLVAPAASELPDVFREIARDPATVVAELPGPLVRLTR